VGDEDGVDWRIAPLCAPPDASWADVLVNEQPHSAAGTRPEPGLVSVLESASLLCGVDQGRPSCAKPTRYTRGPGHFRCGAAHAKGRQAIDHTGLDGLNVHAEYHVATPSHDLSISEAPLPGGGLMASNEVPQVEFVPRPERNWESCTGARYRRSRPRKRYRGTPPTLNKCSNPLPATSTSSSYLTVGGPKPPTGAPGVQNPSWDRPAVDLYRTVGGARGLGRAIAAARLISAGARVVIADVDAEGVPRAAIGADSVPTDVGDPAAVDRLFAWIALRFGNCIFW
jgi:hypothetical protein